MAGEIASAYLSIYPKLEAGKVVDEVSKSMGSAGKSAGKTFGTSVKAGMGDAGTDAGTELGEGISSGLSAKAVVIGNLITDAIRSAAGAAIDLGKELASGVYEGFAANEQLVGGMQKLFGENADTVVANANKAWLTAGRSANEYMEGVTSIAASLVNSVGGDTAEAARLADVAMKAMSDNVNTFGTDAQSVQNAVMGLAKGNYSMLDNLSLGFSGTQQGMVDLINASGVLDHELTKTSDLADVGFGTMVEAIQAVQENMGIADTTINEAMGTLEGSATAAKSAWENVLTSIGTGDASQVKSAVSGLVDSIFGTFNEKTGEREGGLAENLTKLARNAFSALGESLPGIIDEVFNALPPEIGGPLKDAFQTIGDVVSTVAPVVAGAVKAIVGVIKTIAPVVKPLIPLIGGIVAGMAGMSAITGIIGAISGAVGILTGVIMPAIGMISSIPGLIAVITTVLGGPIPIIGAIIGAIVAFVATNEDARNKAVAVFETIKTVMQGAFDAVKAAWPKIKSTISGAVNAIKSVVSVGFNLIRSVISTAMNVVRGIVSAVSAAMRGDWSGALNAMKGAVSAAIGGIKSIFGTLKGAVMGALSGAASWLVGVGRDIVAGLANGIRGAVGWVTSAVSSVCSNALGALKSFFKIGSPSRLMADMGEFMMQGLANGIDAGAIDAVGAMGDASAQIAGALGLDASGPARYGARSLGGSNATVYNVYLNDLAVNDNAGIVNATRGYLMDLARLGAI